jgi:hypothetical protein
MYNSFTNTLNYFENNQFRQHKFTNFHIMEDQPLIATSYAFLVHLVKLDKFYNNQKEFLNYFLQTKTHIYNEYYNDYIFINNPYNYMNLLRINTKLSYSHYILIPYIKNKENGIFVEMSVIKPVECKFKETFYQLDNTINYQKKIIKSIIFKLSNKIGLTPKNKTILVNGNIDDLVDYIYDTKFAFDLVYGDFSICNLESLNKYYPCQETERLKTFLNTFKPSAYEPRFKTVIVSAKEGDRQKNIHIQTIKDTVEYNIHFKLTLYNTEEEIIDNNNKLKSILITDNESKKVDGEGVKKFDFFYIYSIYKLSLFYNVRNGEQFDYEVREFDLYKIFYMNYKTFKSCDIRRIHDIVINTTFMETNIKNITSYFESLVKISKMKFYTIFPCYGEFIPEIYVKGCEDKLIDSSKLIFIESTNIKIYI